MIDVSVVVDEKVNKLGHEDLLFSEGSIKGGDSGGIPSLLRGSGRILSLYEAISCPKLNAQCFHEVGFLVYSATSPINYRYCSFYVTGEWGYDAEELLNMTDIWEHLPRRLNDRGH